MSFSAIGANAYNAQAATAVDFYTRVERPMASQNTDDVKLNNTLTTAQAKLSTQGQLQNALAEFQQAAQEMSDLDIVTSGISSDQDVLNATVSGKTVNGRYAVDVKRLAQGQELSSGVKNAADSAIGTGASTVIKVEFGSTSGKSFTLGDINAAKTININGSNNTLTGIASAFNAAGIDATVVNNGSDFVISLKGPSGSASSMRISASGDTVVGDMLTYNPAIKSRMTQTTSAQDAVLTVNGVEYKSAGNTVNSAIAGITLGLTGKGSSSVVVETDSGQIAGNIVNLVSAYNNLNAKLHPLQRGDLKSDTAMARFSNQLTEALETSINEAPTSALANAGISVDQNGNLLLDEKKLQSAISKDPYQISRLFTNNGNGMADQFAEKTAALISDSDTIRKDAATVNKDAVTLSDMKDVPIKIPASQANALIKLYSQQV